MGEVYGLTTTNNIEVANLYCQVGLKAGDKSVLAPAADLLGRIGRMKFVRPLYVMPSPQPTPRLYLSIHGKQDLTNHTRYRNLSRVDPKLAAETFEKNKDFYHPICRSMVEKDLFGKKDA